MLTEFEILPRGEAGWGSGKLRFGRHTTVVLGPNGSGKTPVMKAIMYALGLPVEFPKDVRERCQAVRLVLTDGLGEHTLERQIVAKGVEVRVQGPDGERTEIATERELSAWVLPRIGTAPRTLTSSGDGSPVPAYLSVAGPMFLVEQDGGWTTGYEPTATFVRDQREEVVRWLLDLPPKHKPVDKSAFRTAEERLGGTREQISFKRLGLEALQRETGADASPDGAVLLRERHATLERELTRMYSALEVLAADSAVYDGRIREATRIRDELGQRHGALRRRMMQVQAAQAEIETELSALEQNEIAADVFRRLCGSGSCQFFRNPEASYGRRVLYLRDQLKDFVTGIGDANTEIGLLGSQLAEAQAALDTTVKEKTDGLARSPGESVVAMLDTLSREIGDVRVRLDRLQRIERERAQLNALLDRERAEAELVDSLRPRARRSGPGDRVLDARSALAGAARRWLAVLRTPNTALDVTWDEDFRFVVDGEVFKKGSGHSGSTRARFVLAYHAALVEASLKTNGQHPRVLILDAPRQQELSAEDLRDFVVEFKKMISTTDPPIQLVYSATDIEVVPAGIDETWAPTFQGPKSPHFLGEVK